MSPQLQIKESQIKIPKAMFFLSMLFLLCDIGGPLLGKKAILMPWGIMLASSFFSALVFMLSDIIAEIYGYKIARQVLILTVVNEIFFCFLFYFFLSLKSPADNNYTQYYDFIFGGIPFKMIWGLCAGLLSWRINVFLLLKLKFMMRGRSFWLRSIASSSLGIIIFTLLVAPEPLLINLANTNHILSALLWSIFIRIILTILFSYPGQIIVNMIRAMERVESAKNDKAYGLD